MTALACSCGFAGGVHVVARRQTADGIAVSMWSDGALGSRFGQALPGVPVARPRSSVAVAVALRVGWLFLGAVELYDLDELPALYRACVRVAKRGGDHGDVRAEAGRKAPLVPHWEVYEADRDGRPRLRFWRLPRLLWADMGVFDHVSHPRGRYELVTIGRDSARGRDLACTTGFHFATLEALSAHLRGEVQS